MLGGGISGLDEEHTAGGLEVRETAGGHLSGAGGGGGEATTAAAAALGNEGQLNLLAGAVEDQRQANAANIFNECRREKPISGKIFLLFFIIIEGFFNCH